MVRALHSAGAISRAREMYQQGALLREIVSETGLPEGTIYYWLEGGAPGMEQLPLIPRRNGTVLSQRRSSLKTTRGSVIARLWRTAERQVADIETRLIAAGGDPNSLATDAKTLSVLARTVRDLVALDTEQTKGAADKQNEETDGPRDFEEFRRELADKMRQLVDAR